MNFENYINEYYDLFAINDNNLINDFALTGRIKSKEKINSDRNIYTKNDIHYTNIKNDVNKRNYAI